MWRRLRRRSMAPGRPLMYGDQLGLALLTIAAIGSGVYVLIRVF